MKKLKNLCRLFAASALFASMTASGTAITPDAGWYGFCFGGVGSAAAAGGCQGEGVGEAGNTMTFTLTDPSLLKVTDAYKVGDVFDIYVDSVLAFTTSAPGAGIETSNPDDAFESGYYSAGSLLLGAGSYSVDIIVVASPFGGGGAYVEVQSAIPVPAAVWLFGSGLLGLVGLARRKKAA